MEYRLIAADGTRVWVLDETVAVRDEEYRPLFLQGFLSTSPTAVPPTRRCVRARRRIASCSRRRAT